MANKPKNEVFSQKRWAGGIADYPKETSNGQIQDAYYFGKAVNYRDDPQSITLLPAPLKKSGSVVIDLLKWADRVPVTLTSFLYGDAGNIYQRTSAGVYSNLHTVSSSHGNGLAYFTADDYVYYTSDSVLGRYGPTQGTPQFSDNFLKAQGGVPQNTASLSLLSASSQYATAADSASLSVTGNLTLEAYFNATTLPATGSSMTLIGKWDESLNHRSYKLDLFGVSGYFGNGGDSSLTISSDTTEAPIDSACTGTAGTQTLSATNASFAAGQVILIHQTQGTKAGQWERNTIQGYTAGTITLGTPLIGTYVSGAQVRTLPQYTNVTINSGKTYTAKAWNGTVGGILAFLASGTVTVTGNISANGTGYRGGANLGDGADGLPGEGTPGYLQAAQVAANADGGGGGQQGKGGGGGGLGTVGGTATGLNAGIGGGTAGSTDLTSLIFGGGGGSSADGQKGGNGGKGGGIVFISGVTLTISGSVTSTGADGLPGTSGFFSGGGGAGSGGSILLKAQTATLGSSLITANGGTGGVGVGGGTNGGAGGSGRICLDYLTSYTGTTTPTLNAILDNTLVTTTTIQARLGISNDGTAFEYLTQNLNTLTTGVWNRLSVAWTASTSMATFYLNAVSLGTSTGTKTAISDNTSLLYLGADKGASAVGDFFNGLLDDVRVWGNVQTAGQIYANNQIEINASSAGLEAYWKLNSSASDSTSNANTLTLVNTPSYSSNVPFPDPTTRLDIDQQNTNTGQLYTLPTAISEASTDLISFTPATDPQSSVAFYVDTKGTGDWTVTVHDQQNNLIATQTIANASVPSAGAIEFVFTNQWRVFLGKTYHMHLTVSTGTSKVVTGTISDFSTAEYATYFGFLVTDTQFHPVIQFQYQPLGGVLTGAMIIGNERYIAVWDGSTYSPNFITFPPAWRVRCFGFWREFLAIGMWRGGSISDFDRGRIYFWDGIAPTFNFFIDIPEGQINALQGVDTDLYIIAGYRGYLLDYQGTFIQDTGNGQGIKVKRVPLIQPQDTIEVFPGAFTMWRSLLHIGYGNNMSSSTIQQGVYAHGTYNKYYPDTMSYDYQISTGNTGSTVNIGLVYPIGQSLVIGWKDGISFGADEVNFSNPYAAVGELQTFIMDDSRIWRQKENFSVRPDYLPLTSGSSIAPEIQIDRGGFIVGNTDATVGSHFTHLPFAGGRGHEYQIGVKLFSTGTTTPTLTGLSLLKDKVEEEGQF